MSKIPLTTKKEKQKSKGREVKTSQTKVFSYRGFNKEYEKKNMPQSIKRNLQNTSSFMCVQGIQQG